MKRLVAWIVVRGPLGRAFTDPSLPGFSMDGDDLIDAVLVPRRLRREQDAAGTGAQQQGGVRDA